MKLKHMKTILDRIVNNTIPYKEKETQVYNKDLKIIIEEFHEYFISVGRNTAEIALNLAKQNNTTLSNPLLNSKTYSSEQQFNFSK